MLQHSPNMAVTDKRLAQMGDANIFRTIRLLKIWILPVLFILLISDISNPAAMAEIMGGNTTSVECEGHLSFQESRGQESKNYTMCSNLDNELLFKSYSTWKCLYVGESVVNKMVTTRQIHLFAFACERAVETRQCSQEREFDDIYREICNNDLPDLPCKLFQTEAGEQVTCQHFVAGINGALRTTDSTRNSLFEETMMSPPNIVAFVCAAFILLSIILVLLVPEEYCRVQYQSERDMGLRVPLEIYEMYGVHYMPSNRRLVVQEQCSNHLRSYSTNRKAATVVPLNVGGNLNPQQTNQVDNTDTINYDVV